MKYNKGFSLIEIILALAVSVIVFVGIFHFAASAYITHIPAARDEEYFSYTYGEHYCPMTIDLEQMHFDPVNTIDLSLFISTSTRISSLHFLQRDKIILTTDSASTSESDIFLFKINTQFATVTLEVHIDVGPGIQDAKILDTYLYIANTSVNSHVKTLSVDVSSAGTQFFSEIENIKIPSLALSSSLPKKLAVYGKQLVLGSEKSNTGPEIFIFPLAQNGKLGPLIKTIELDGQMNQALEGFGNMFIANAADPELRVLDRMFSQLFAYDAPLTLGNGKSILYKPPYILLGRTLGSGELSMLEQNGTSTHVRDTKRTYGTVDFIQDLGNKNILTFTANEEKELQFWKFDTSLVHAKDINIPGRAMSYSCAHGNLYIPLLVQNHPKLIWLHM